MIALLLLFAADVTPRQALERIGQTITVRFTVLGTGANGAGFLEAYSEKEWNVPNTFYLRVPKASAPAIFKKLSLTMMEDFTECELRVTGKAERLQFGKDGPFATIVVSSADQIQVLSRPKPKYTPTKLYTRRIIEGFEVLVHPDLVADAKEYPAAVKELTRQLAEMPKYLPEDKYQRLKKVRIWLERRQKGAASGAAFHPGTGWLRANGYNPEKVGAVEVSNSKALVEWTDQPYMLMHEMAHAYHHLVLGAEHAKVKSAYKQAMDRKLYDKVKHANGSTVKSYATTNEFEYFAELSEAYFGKNDFFPFVRSELQKHDAQGFALMAEIWGKPRK